LETLTVPASVRRKLGDDGSEGLVEMFSLYHQLTSERFERRVMETSERFDRRLMEEVSGLRLEMHEGFAAIRREMAASHVDWLRWSFLFWLGQLAAIAGLLVTIR
jgi:hypothetical protein